MAQPLANPYLEGQTYRWEDNPYEFSERSHLAGDRGGPAGRVLREPERAHQEGGGEISYSQLLKQVDAGQIKSAEISSQVVQAKDASGKVLTVNAPIDFR